MIFRFSTKLAARLKVEPSKVLSLNPNPFADWSAHLFVADRTQVVIVTNTASLYSTLFYGRGIANERQFIECASRSIDEHLKDDGLSFLYKILIASASFTVQFSKALSRSVTGSMNDMIFHAKAWLTEDKLSPQQASFLLNDIPFSSLDYRKPREVFSSLTVAPPER